MSGITLERAQQHLLAWLEAELAITTSQSYTIGSRSLTRANLDEVRQQVAYWENKVAQLQNISKRKGRNRITRIVPRDL